MAELVFDCIDITPDRYAAAPSLVARLRIAETTGATVHALILRCQIRIEPQRRSYTDAQREALYDVFGTPKQWGESLRPLQFALVTHSVQGFRHHTETELSIPVTYDLEVSCGRLLDALEDGEVPMLLLFSGTVFCKTDTGFEVEQIPWEKEASFRMPARRWRELMDLYFPGEGWLRLSRSTIEGLRRFKSARAIPTWDMTVERLLKEVDE